MQRGGDHDLGAIVAAQMREVCDRLPAHVAPSGAGALQIWIFRFSGLRL
jgi:hypothetical protein